MKIIVDAPAANTLFPRFLQCRQHLCRRQIMKVQIRRQTRDGLGRLVSVQTEGQIAARERGKYFCQCMSPGQTAFLMQPDAQCRAVASFDYRRNYPNRPSSGIPIGANGRPNGFPADFYRQHEETFRRMRMGFTKGTSFSTNSTTRTLPSG